MQLISEVSMKKTSALHNSGTFQISPFISSLLSLKSPLPQGSSLSFSSFNHSGWVKSPVPMTVIPLSCAHFQSDSGSRSLLVAREYFEWMCRSAIKRIRKYSTLNGRQEKGQVVYRLQ